MNHPKKEPARSSRITRFTYIAAIFAAACMAFPRAATAQSLDDWKEAKSAADSGKGPESIPYSSLRDEAKNKQAMVDDFCKNESWSCDGLETKSLREEIKGRSSKIEELKTKIEELKKQQEQAAKELEKQSSELEFKQKSLETDLKDIDIRLGKGAQCLEARTSVQRAFKDASDKARGENDSDIKAIATQLIDYWERAGRKHQEAFDNTKAGIEKCQKCKSGDL